MNTVCTHCNKWFEVSDKALGKNARCPSCTKVFVVAPAAVSHDDSGLEELRSPGGSTTRLSAVRENEEYDPGEESLSALAEAAEASGYNRMERVHEHAREHGSSVSRRARGEKRGMASGAVASVVFGSIGIGFSIILLVLVILAAVDVFSIGTGLLAGLFISGVVICMLCLLGVVQGGNARKRIRRARGTLYGSGQATTGILLGWIGLAIVLAAATTLLIDISKSGGIVIEERTIPAN